MPDAFDIPDNGLPGEFWVDDSPRERGRLMWDEAGKPCVVAEGVIRESTTLRVANGPGYTEITSLGGPREIVANTIPMSVLGKLDDGPLVTLRESILLSGFSPTPQRHVGLSLLIGAHAPSVDARFGSARFTIPRSGAWRMLFAHDPTTVILGDAEAQLAAYTTDNEAWIELSVEGGLPTREWERSFWYRCCILMSLWANQDVRPGRVQLKLAASDDWVEQVWRRERSATTFDWAGSFLPPWDLTLEHIARALRAFAQWGTVAEIASRDSVHGTSIQTAVFLYASGLEGLHHHCYENRKPFPGLSNSKTQRVAKQAAEAAIIAASELGANVGNPEEAQQRIFSAFQYFNQLTYDERLKDLLPAIKEAAPGLIGQDDQTWIEWVVAARNQEAHRRPRRTNWELLEESDHYYQLAVSTQWALRLSILVQLGVEAAVLRLRLAQHQRFVLALANMDRSEFSWPGSRLDDFIAATEQDAAAEYQEGVVHPEAPGPPTPPLGATTDQR